MVNTEEGLSDRCVDLALPGADMPETNEASVVAMVLNKILCGGRENRTYIEYQDVSIFMHVHTT